MIFVMSGDPQQTWWPRLTTAERVAFEAERRGAEVGRGPRNVIIAALIHASFAPVDVFLLPDVIGLALVLRLGVVIPLVLLTLPVCTALHRAGRHRASELAQVGVALVLNTTLAVTLLLTHSPTAVGYFCGFFPVMTFFALALRLSLGAVVGAIAALAATSVAGVAGTSVLPLVIKVEVCSVLVVTAALLVVMVASREVDLRRSFLLRSRLRVLVAERDAGLEALREANAELARLSEVDELTRVPNRRALVARLQEWDATGSWGAAAMVDVDHFKALNDVHGHAAGDECLRSVAGALAEAAGTLGGAVARYGGEEFAVLLPGADAVRAGAAAQRLREAVAACRSDELGVTVSIGWAVAGPGDGVASTLLLQRADAAVLAAKAAGRDRAVAWSDVPRDERHDEPRGGRGASGSGAPGTSGAVGAQA